jgi:uncharacterized DUF497 family protein
VEISFDPEKRAITLERRGLDFADARQVFDTEVVMFEDDRYPYPEPRFVSFGYLRDRIVAVVWAEAVEGRRIISMRKANDREQARYRQRMD